MISDPYMTSCISGSNVSTLLGKENQPSVTWQSEKKRWNKDKSIFALGRWAQHAPRLTDTVTQHTHSHIHKHNQNKQTIAARGRFSLLHSPLHRQMRSWPPTDNLPPMSSALLYYITQKQQLSSLAIIVHTPPTIWAWCWSNWMGCTNHDLVINWHKLTLIMWPLTHPSQPKAEVSWRSGSCGCLPLNVPDFFLTMVTFVSSFSLPLFFLSLLLATIKIKAKMSAKVNQGPVCNQNSLVWHLWTFLGNFNVLSLR